jgi:hypothetical protein
MWDSKLQLTYVVSESDTAQTSNHWNSGRQHSVGSVTATAGIFVFLGSRPALGLLDLDAVGPRAYVWGPTLVGDSGINNLFLKCAVWCHTKHSDWFYNESKGKGKGKAVPLQAWSGPEGSRKLRFADYVTVAQDGGKGKGKAVPLQAWSGPEVYRKLRFPDYVTTVQDGGKVVSLTHRPPLPPGNTPVTHFC